MKTVVVTELQLAAAEDVRKLRGLVGSSRRALGARSRKHALDKTRARLEQDATEAQALRDGVAGIVDGHSRARAALSDALDRWSAGWGDRHAELEARVADLVDRVLGVLATAHADVDDALDAAACDAARLADNLEELALHGDALKGPDASRSAAEALARVGEFEAALGSMMDLVPDAVSGLEARLGQARVHAAYRTAGSDLAAVRYDMDQLAAETHALRRLASYLRGTEAHDLGARGPAKILGGLASRAAASGSRSASSRRASHRRPASASPSRSRRSSSRASPGASASNDVVSRQEYETLLRQYYELEDALDRERRAKRVCERCRMWEDKVRELRVETRRLKKMLRSEQASTDALQASIISLKERAAWRESGSFASLSSVHGSEPSPKHARFADSHFADSSLSLESLAAASRSGRGARDSDNDSDDEDSGVAGPLDLSVSTPRASTMVKVTDHAGSPLKSVCVAALEVDGGLPIASCARDGSIKVTLVAPDSLRPSRWVSLDIGRVDADGGDNDIPAPASIVVFHPKGLLLAVASGSVFQLVNWDKGRVLRRHAAPAPVSSLAFDPNGQFILAGLASGAILVYEIMSGEAVATVSLGPREAVTAVAAFARPDLRDDDALLLMCGGNFGHIYAVLLNPAHLSSDITVALVGGDAVRDTVGAPIRAVSASVALDSTGQVIQYAVLAPPSPSSPSTPSTPSSLSPARFSVPLVTTWNIRSPVAAAALVHDTAGSSVLMAGYSDGHVVGFTAHTDRAPQTLSLACASPSSDPTALTAIAADSATRTLAVGTQSSHVLATIATSLS